MAAQFNAKNTSTSEISKLDKSIILNTARDELNRLDKLKTAEMNEKSPQATRVIIQILNQNHSMRKGFHESTWLVITIYDSIL